MVFNNLLRLTIKEASKSSNTERVIIVLQKGHDLANSVMLWDAKYILCDIPKRIVL